MKKFFDWLTRVDLWMVDKLETFALASFEYDPPSEPAKAVSVNGGRHRAARGRSTMQMNRRARASWQS